MKRLISFLIVLGFLVIAYPAMADEDGIKFWDKQVVGAQVDAPNLIKLFKDVSIGSEVTHNLNQTSIDEDWTFLAKVTVNWTFLDLTKK